MSRNWMAQIVLANPLSFAKGSCKDAACGAGWEDLLVRCFKAIEAHLRANPDVSFYCTDIKQKYGTLRLYFDGGDDVIETIVEEAEFWSARTCEYCGKAGILAGKYWVQTVCPEHKKLEDPWSRKLSDWTKA